MQKLVLVLTATFFLSRLYAQSQVEIIKDGDTKILKGIISKDMIASDTSFTWWRQNQQGFTPNPQAVEALKKNGAGLSFIVFGGTWCGDTQYLLPKYFSWLEAAQFPLNQVTLLGVDRNKKTLGNLAGALGIVNVPTFIIMKDGKEVGRVVEYGKYGQPDKELGEMISNIH